jgi:hypothetical protein
MSNKLNMVLTGDLSETINSINWTGSEQLEQVITINSGDGQKTIDLTTVNNIKLIYIFSNDDNFSIEITIGSDAITFENDFFINTPSAVFLATITSFKISTTSTSDISVYINLYGEA